MPTLRLLLALFLIALGTTGAAFAISGYFDPRLWPADGKSAAAADGKPKLDVAVQKPRERFVAIEAKVKPAAANTEATTAAVRPKPAPAKAPAKKPPATKDAGVQQASWWPLADLFKN
jgi:hypothetical protein